MQHLPEASATRKALSLRVDTEALADAQTLSDISDWSLTDQLLAHIVDLCAIANWQRGGGKRGKPKLISAGTRRTAKPAAGIDVRAALDRIAPTPVSGQEDAAPEQ